MDEMNMTQAVVDGLGSAMKVFFVTIGAFGVCIGIAVVIGLVVGVVRDRRASRRDNEP